MDNVHQCLIYSEFKNLPKTYNRNLLYKLFDFFDHHKCKDLTPTLGILLLVTSLLILWCFYILFIQ